MKFIAIIPARYASTRFPGKPLVLLGGKPIIQHVYERVQPYFDRVIVATDDERILACVTSFGGEAIMTSSEHQSGTDRICEAYTRSGMQADVVVNVQGDEPFVQQSHFELLKQCFENPQTQIATLVKRFPENATFDDISNPNTPKVVCDTTGRALYFSRSIIPYLRGVEPTTWAQTIPYYKHLGLYAFKSEVLQEVTQLPQSHLELAESLEQLRWLENGYTIRVAETDCETIGIDTPEDLAKAEQMLNNL